MTCELIVLAVGMRIGYYSGVIPKLIEDIQGLKPTAICSVPRVLNRIVCEMKKKLEEKPWYIQLLIKAGIHLKLNNNMSFLLDLLFKPFKGVLGGRIRFTVSSGTLILRDVFEFLRAVITPAIIQGIGMTECAGGYVSKSCLIKTRIQLGFLLFVLKLN